MDNIVTDSGLILPKPKTTIVKEQQDRFGLYLWQMPNGSYIADEEQNFLSIPSEYGDPRKIQILRDAVKAHGINEGDPVFFPGVRQVTDEEYAEQQGRMNDGLVPDKYDIGWRNDELKEKR